MVVTPGQSMSLTCTVSGFSLSDYWTHWIRQPAGQALEWIGEVYGDGTTLYSDKLKSRFQLTADTSSSTVTLRGQNLQAGDTAVYYCARELSTKFSRSILTETQASYPSSSTMFSTSLLLLLAAASCVHCEELTQPGSMVVRPGQSLTIDCKVSYSVTSYGTGWIRQPSGKALEWIGSIAYSGSLYYSDKLKNKFSISRNTGTN
ncbi:hypothetical protein NFI96_032522, partial [Prochilodus magdalenae]